MKKHFFWSRGSLLKLRRSFLHADAQYIFFQIHLLIKMADLKFCVLTEDYRPKYCTMIK